MSPIWCCSTRQHATSRLTPEVSPRSSLSAIHWSGLQCREHFGLIHDFRGGQPAVSRNDRECSNRYCIENFGLDRGQAAVSLQQFSDKHSRGADYTFCARRRLIGEDVRGYSGSSESRV